MRSRFQHSETQDTTALSFLDVVSCGLGAAIFLGLLFAAVRHVPPVDARSPSFIQVRFTVEGTPANPAGRSSLNLRITPPGGDAFVPELDREVEALTGRWLGPRLAGQLSFVGFRPFEGHLAIDQTSTAAMAPARDFILVVRDPAPGRWNFEPLIVSNDLLPEVWDVAALSQLPSAAHQRPFKILRTITTRRLTVAQTVNEVRVAAPPAANTWQPVEVYP